MAGLTETPENVCVPVDWLQMDGVTTSSFPPNAAVDKTTFIFTEDSGVIYIQSEVLSQIIALISFRANNVAIVKVEIINAVGGISANFSKPVTNDVSLKFG